MDRRVVRDRGHEPALPIALALALVEERMGLDQAEELRRGAAVGRGPGGEGQARGERDDHVGRLEETLGVDDRAHVDLGPGLARRAAGLGGLDPARLLDGVVEGELEAPRGVLPVDRRRDRPRHDGHRAPHDQVLRLALDRHGDAQLAPRLQDAHGVVGVGLAVVLVDHNEPVPQGVRAHVVEAHGSQARDRHDGLGRHGGRDRVEHARLPRARRREQENVEGRAHEARRRSQVDEALVPLLADVPEGFHGARDAIEEVGGGQDPLGGLALGSRERHRFRHSVAGLGGSLDLVKEHGQVAHDVAGRAAEVLGHEPRQALALPVGVEVGAVDEGSTLGLLEAHGDDDLPAGLRGGAVEHVAEAFDDERERVVGDGVGCGGLAGHGRLRG